MVLNNHLCATPTPADNDCRAGRENSPCHVPCPLYDQTVAALPTDWTLLRVHPDDVTLCD
jgi:hypothetical protein